MYLKTLQLVKKNGQVIRHVDFHSGVNFVVDEEASDTHNHVGKTTFLKLIDIALGSKDKKLIYTDIQTNTKNIALENFIEGQKVSIELYLCDKLCSSDAKDIRLKVDLFKKGHRYINDERKKINEYNAELNELLFNNTKNIPTFRELIPYFVRVSAKRENYDFLQNLHSSTSRVTYRAIYNYLFDISDSQAFDKLEKAKKQLDQVQKASKNYRKLDNNNQDEEILAQKLEANRARQKQLQREVNDLVKGTDFVNNREAITDARQQYIKMKNKLDALQYRLSRIKEDIQSTEAEQTKLNPNLTRDFFNEIKQAMPRVNKTYEDLVSFNNALKSNKLNYLKNLRDQLQEKIDIAKKKQQDFLDENSDIVALIKNNDIAKYDELNQELAEVSKTVAKQEEIYSTLYKFSKVEENLRNGIARLQENAMDTSAGYQPKLNIFNQCFTELASEINNIQPILAYHKNLKEFPVSVEDLDEGTSSGTLKSLILCYDIAYQQFAMKIGKQVPNFVVYDTLESVEGDVVLKLVDKIKTMSIQVVVAILKEKLDSSRIDQNFQMRNTILSLSNDNRVFEPSDQ
ncbi:DUF2326 domain-containing protein [Lactobacillus porci]|uniref:DUF2326 domain-containing protein n=1 Tax=Lactobacillus porci TaxID=2012477 RepID=UPI00399429A6